MGEREGGQVMGKGGVGGRRDEGNLGRGMLCPLQWLRSSVFWVTQDVFISLFHPAIGFHSHERQLFKYSRVMACTLVPLEIIVHEMSI